MALGGGDWITSCGEGILEKPASGDSRAQVPGKVNDSCPGALELIHNEQVILLSGAPTYVGRRSPAGKVPRPHCL